MQLSFTLPIAWSEAADEAARQLVAKMGFTDVAVVEGRAIATGFSFFVVYARTPVAIDVVADRTRRRRRATRSRWSRSTSSIAKRVGRKLRVAGACIGTDAHTVGIDAILNMKGYKGDYGLERYEASRCSTSAARSRSKISCASRSEHDVDAILASQVVTQKGSDIANFTALAELLEAEHLRDRVVLIAGGPRVTNLLAAELGYDAGFGRGTLPSDVATFIARRLAERVPA